MPYKAPGNGALQDAGAFNKWPSVFVLCNSLCDLNPAGMKLPRVFALFALVVGGTAKDVVESAREIPVAYDVDVVVVGGTVGGVTAAVEAAKKGASVFLAAPRPYLGEDVTGTLRLWLDEKQQPRTALEREVFVRESPITGFPNRLPFTYTADQKPNRVHPDPKQTVLTDSKWQNAVKQSVQYDADVTLIADLGRIVRLQELHLFGFLRRGEFEVADVELWTSPNGRLWRSLGSIKDQDTGSDPEVHFQREIKQPCRFVKLLVKKAENAKRILLGELLLIEDREVEIVDTVRAPATPMQVKIALDEALLAAGVQYLYGSATTDILHDANGQPAGIVIANRAGRQAVKAKVIIDATARATAARSAGAQFQPWPGGEQVFQRIAVGGPLREGKGIVSGETADVHFYSKEGEHDVHIYQLKIPMSDASPKSFAAAEVLAREWTFTEEIVDESDRLFQIPPDPMIGRATLVGGELDLDSLQLASLQPKQIERFYVLGGCADVSREAAAKLVQPLNQMRLGQRVGKHAAEVAKSVSAPENVRVFSELAGANTQTHGEVREFLNGARPTHRGLSTIPSPRRKLPVLGEYDVVVAGGGTGGAPAGIGAGRHGASALVIEFQDHLGGVGTQGLISQYYHGYRKGFTLEVDDGVKEIGGPRRRGGWNPVTKREWWRRANAKEGTDIWFSALACGAWVVDGTVRGVVVATPEGRGVVLAGTVIDSTGNSDIAVAAGADFITTSAEHVAMQGTGLSPRALGTGYMNTDYSFADESDVVGQWRMIVAARRKYKNSYDLSSFIDSRERRRIVGEAFVDPLDIVNKKTWHDTISMHQSNFDTHGYTVHPLFFIDFPDKKSMTAPVPFRALLPRNVDGLIVTGLSMSAHRDSMPVLRMQACIQNQGYAAGVAAAFVTARGVTPRSLDVRKLQRHLVEIGSLPKEVLTHEDSSTVGDEAVKSAVTTVVQDHHGLSVILRNAVRAMPHLEAAYQATDDPEHRLTYANILGMLGNATGAPTLAAHIRKSEWDQGWNFRGMGQYGGSISRLDSHIIALGKSGAPEALAVILEKVASLTAANEFSHHRTVALACETIRHQSAAKPLADLLGRDRMTGYAIGNITESNRQEQRSEPLREIILARALYRCGDHNGLGEKILRQYEQDLRGLFAKHAHAVLNE